MHFFKMGKRSSFINTIKTLKHIKIFKEKFKKNLNSSERHESNERIDNIVFG